MNLIKALRSMGYRRPDPTIDPNRWAKPFGHTIFIAHVKERRINSHFYAPNGEFCLWITKELPADMSEKDYVLRIGDFEQYENAADAVPQKPLPFTTAEERANDICNFL